MATIYPFRRKGGFGGDNPIPDMPFRVAHRLSGNTAFVEIEGELDLLTAPRLRDVLSMIFSGALRPTHLVIDASRVSFMDSTGYLAIEEVAGGQRWNGELEIKDPSPQVSRFLELVRELPIP